MPDLKAGFWTSALIRRAEIGGAFAAVVKRGDADAGACLVKVRRPDGTATLYRPIRNMAGERVWLPKGPSEERNIDDYVNARIDSNMAATMRPAIKPYQTPLAPTSVFKANI